MLTGIVVNNAIILVSTYLQNLNNLNYRIINVSIINRIIVQSSKERFRPIMITTLTTILGLLPTAFDPGQGSELWRPLAITVVSGLAISTLITLYLVPVIFSFVYVKLKTNYSS